MKLHKVFLWKWILTTSSTSIQEPALVRSLEISSVQPMNFLPVREVYATLVCITMALCLSDFSWSQVSPGASISQDSSAQAPVTPPAQGPAIPPAHGPVASSTSAPIQAPDYMIGVDDVLDVYIVDVPE